MIKTCNICKLSFSEEIPPSGEDILCATCKEIVRINKKKGFSATEVKKALSRASYIDADGNSHFLCHYTGVPCDIDLGAKFDSNSLWHAFDLSFDHLEPSKGYGTKGKEIVVCLNIVNQVKSNIPASIFKEFIILLAKKLEQQGSFEYDPAFKSELLNLLYKD